jgi:8-oxo-dGTP pyrophosphatase MutT (NUDIX family)
MARIPTRIQTSAGEVAFRRQDSRIEVALIAVGEQLRWQLPKGLVDQGEAPEEAARREVREEAGIETDLVQPLERIEYWYYGTEQGVRVRYHKFVHFYLLSYVAGEVQDHDAEVADARWVELAEAKKLLAFASERRVLERAEQVLAS